MNAAKSNSSDQEYERYKIKFKCEVLTRILGFEPGDMQIQTYNEPGCEETTKKLRVKNRGFKSTMNSMHFAFSVTIYSSWTLSIDITDHISDMPLNPDLGYAQTDI